MGHVEFDNGTTYEAVTQLIGEAHGVGPGAIVLVHGTEKIMSDHDFNKLATNNPDLMLTYAIDETKPFRDRLINCFGRYSEGQVDLSFGDPGMVVDVCETRLNFSLRCLESILGQGLIIHGGGRLMYSTITRQIDGQVTYPDLSKGPVRDMGDLDRMVPQNFTFWLGLSAYNANEKSDQPVFIRVRYQNAPIDAMVDFIVALLRVTLQGSN